MKRIHIIGVMAACAVMLSACGATSETAQTTAEETTTAAVSEVISEMEAPTATTTESETTTVTVTETEMVTETTPEITETVTEVTAFTDDFDEETIEELSGNESLTITDLNGDGRRERIFCYNPFGFCNITYYDSSDNKQMIEFDVMSAWGGTWYFKETKQIVNLSYFAHTYGTGSGFEMSVYDFSGKDITLVKSYTAAGGERIDENSIPIDMTYFLDNEELAYDEAVSQLSNMSEEFEKEFGYPLFVYDEMNPDNYIINYELISNYPTNLNNLS